MNTDEKKEYMAPKMEILDLNTQSAILCGSGCDDGYGDYGDGVAE